MKFNFEKRFLKMGFIAFLVIAASICFYYIVFHGDRISGGLNFITTVLSPVLYGIIFSYLMTPMLNTIEDKLLNRLFTMKGHVLTVKKKKGIRAISILMTVIIVFILIYGFFSVLIPNIFKSIKSISYQFPYYVHNLTRWSQKFLADNPDIESIVLHILDTYSEELATYLNESIIPRMEAILMQVSMSMISILKMLWNFIIGFIISIYVLYNKEIFAGQAKKLLYSFLKTSSANQFIKDVRFTSNTFIGFIGGKIIDSFIIGCLCFAGTSLLNIPYALLISVIIGVTNIIPFFGPYLGAIPSALLILMVNPVKCLYFIIFILILQQIDGNLIGPKILGESTGLSGFWVICSITVFGGVFGVLGMIIGVPTFAVIYAWVRRISNRKLKKKGLPTETAQYINVESIQDLVFIEQKPDAKNTMFGYKSKTKSPEAVDAKKTEQAEEKANEKGEGL